MGRVSPRLQARARAAAEALPSTPRVPRAFGTESAIPQAASVLGARTRKQAPSCRVASTCSLARSCTHVRARPDQARTARAATPPRGHLPSAAVEPPTGSAASGLVRPPRQAHPLVNQPARRDAARKYSASGGARVVSRSAQRPEQPFAAEVAAAAAVVAGGQRHPEAAPCVAFPERAARCCPPGGCSLANRTRPRVASRATLHAKHFPPPHPHGLPVHVASAGSSCAIRCLHLPQHHREPRLAPWQ